MCTASAVVKRRLFAGQPFVVITHIHKPKRLYTKKTLLQTPFELFLHSKLKTEKSYPTKSKWEVIVKWHTHFNPCLTEVFPIMRLIGGGSSEPHTYVCKYVHTSESTSRFSHCKRCLITLSNLPKAT